MTIARLWHSVLPTSALARLADILAAHPDARGFPALRVSVVASGRPDYGPAYGIVRYRVKLGLAGWPVLAAQEVAAREYRSRRLAEYDARRRARHEGRALLSWRRGRLTEDQAAELLQLPLFVAWQQASSLTTVDTDTLNR